MNRPPPPDDRSTLRDLARLGVAGSHARWTEPEIRDRIRAVVAGEAGALSGLEPVYGATTDDVVAAMATVWGWSHRQVMASTNPEATLRAFTTLVDRVVEVGESGGTVAVATGRPASLLSLYSALVRMARARGASVIEQHDTAPSVRDGRAGRFLRWVDGIAVLTDGEALLSSAGVGAGVDWVFQVGRADLWLCDHGFAGAALRSGGRIAAFVDFDTIALALAATRVGAEQAVVVPLDDQRPPLAYQILIDLVSHRINH